MTRGGWQQVPLLKDQLLESQDKLLKALKELTTAEEEKQKEAVVIEAWKTLFGMNGKVYRAEEDARVAKEAMEKAQEEAARSKDEAALGEEVAVKA